MLPVITGAPNAPVTQGPGKMHEFILSEHRELLFTVFLLEIGPGHLSLHRYCHSTYFDAQNASEMCSIS